MRAYRAFRVRAGTTVEQRPASIITVICLLDVLLPRGEDNAIQRHSFVTTEQKAQLIQVCPSTECREKL